MSLVVTAMSARGSQFDDVTDLRAQREEPWFNFVMSWEKPTRGRGYRRARRRWRQRHERIFRLEQTLGYIDSNWKDYDVFPWVYLSYGDYW